MQTLKISLSAETVREAEHFKISDPVLFALQRATGTLWNIREDGRAEEIIAPYRQWWLPLEAQRWRREYFKHRAAALPEMNVEVEFFEVESGEAGAPQSQGGSTHAPQQSAPEYESRINGVEIMIRIMPEDWETDAEALESIVLKALEKRTDSPWRAVCPSLFVECAEPYSTIIVRHDALKELRATQALHIRNRTGYSSGASLKQSQKSYQFKAELYAPLSPAALIAPPIAFRQDSSGV